MPTGVRFRLHRRQKDIPLPRVSVVIPTYNRAALLPRAIDSVLAQTNPPLEILVVDDGSTDTTERLIGDCYPQVSALTQENQGVSAARNRGIKESKGEFIAFLDSDDSWMKSKLERQVEAMDKDPTLKLCHTEEMWIRNGRRVNPMKQHRKHDGWIFKECLPLCAISPSATLVRRELFDEVGVFDESFPACEDYDLWLRVTSRYPARLIDEALVIKHGGHDDQLSRKHWGMDRFRIRALENILNEAHLKPDDRAAALQELIRKIEIFMTGARKRGNTEGLDEYEVTLEWAKTEAKAMRADGATGEKG